MPIIATWRDTPNSLVTSLDRMRCTIFESYRVEFPERPDHLFGRSIKKRSIFERKKIKDLHIFFFEKTI